MLIGARPLGAGERMTLKVSPAVAFAPANLVVRATITADADNRAVEIVAESNDFYRSSQIQLEGDRAPRTFSIEYPNVPGGSYEITSVLANSTGRERAVVHQTAHVVPPGGDS